mmetsp:Transcript_3726/g.9611  ORF Transcript_3726/g.9611 Transcript_3726/m.9611 type:complete len:228 (-) Transcript_3726:898-1581(-)
MGSHTRESHGEAIWQLLQAPVWQLRDCFPCVHGPREHQDVGEEWHGLDRKHLSEGGYAFQSGAGHAGDQGWRPLLRDDSRLRCPELPPGGLVERRRSRESEARWARGGACLLASRGRRHRQPVARKDAQPLGKRPGVEGRVVRQRRHVAEAPRGEASTTPDFRPRRCVLDGLGGLRKQLRLRLRLPQDDAGSKGLQCGDHTQGQGGVAHWRGASKGRERRRRAFQEG